VPAADDGPTLENLHHLLSWGYLASMRLQDGQRKVKPVRVTVFRCESRGWVPLKAAPGPKTFRLEGREQRS
jgi:hypothetical protein